MELIGKLLQWGTLTQHARLGRRAGCIPVENTPALLFQLLIINSASIVGVQLRDYVAPIIVTVYTKVK